MRSTEHAACMRRASSCDSGSEPETADVAFGIITIVTGVLSSVAGGYIVDRLGAKPGGTAWFCAASLVAYAAAVVPTTEEYEEGKLATGRGRRQ